MNNVRRTFLIFGVLLMQWALPAQGGVSSMAYDPFPVGALLDYEVELPGQSAKSLSTLRVIYRAKDYVIFRRSVIYDYTPGRKSFSPKKDVAFFIEYKGFMVMPCGEPFRKPKSQLEAIDALWPLKEGNKSDTAGLSFNVRQSTHKSTHFSGDGNIFVIEEKSKEGKVKYSISPSHNAIMQILWFDGTVENLIKIKLPQEDAGKGVIPSSCKANIPGWFWGKS